MTALVAGAGALLGAIVASGAYTDIRYRRLPNRLCVIALVAGAGFSLASGGWPVLLFALLHAALALGVGIALFALGGIGAGDAKFYAALAAWFSLWDGARLLVSVSLAGLLLLVVWSVWRLKRPRRSREEATLFDKLPYGVAISIGAAVAFALVHG